MAAAADPHRWSLVDLREITVAQLDPLLEEEDRTWQRELHWDFHASSDLVRRFVRLQSLLGVALLWHGRCLGYAYAVHEHRKGLVGDLFISNEVADAAQEERLLAATLRQLAGIQEIRRIECQLLMMRHLTPAHVPYAPYATSFERRFMATSLSHTHLLPESACADHYRFEGWGDQRQDEAAHLIGQSYRSHVDADINDQYQTVAGARRFLSNIIQYPGCGAFDPGGSLVAYDRATRRAAAVVLSSVVAHDIGHITQICVAPEHRGRGLGFEILRRSLQSLRQRGFAEASLTVTGSNAGAIRLYERLGFRKKRSFYAHVWENMPRY